MKCPKCGKELQIIEETSNLDLKGKTVYRNVGYCYVCDTKTVIKDKPDLEKNSKLSWAALVFAIITCIIPMLKYLSLLTASIGVILGVIDLCKRKVRRKHIGSWISVVVFAAIIISMFFR